MNAKQHMFCFFFNNLVAGVEIQICSNTWTPQASADNLFRRANILTRVHQNLYKSVAVLRNFKNIWRLMRTRTFVQRPKRNYARTEYRRLYAKQIFYTCSNTRCASKSIRFGHVTENLKNINANHRNLIKWTKIMQAILKLCSWVGGNGDRKLCIGYRDDAMCRRMIVNTNLWMQRSPYLPGQESQRHSEFRALATSSWPKHQLQYMPAT